MSSVRSFSSFAPTVSTAAPPADEGGWTSVTRRRGQPAPPSAAASATGWGVPTARPKPTTSSWASTTAPPAVATAPDTRSMKDFPSLGAAAGSVRPAARAPTTVASPPVSSWSATVATAAASEPTTAPQYVSRLRGISASDTSITPSSSRRPAASSRLANIGTRCFDDGPADYDGPEEHDDDDGAGSYRVDDEYVTAADTTEEASGEFNSHLMSGRRAGDKSDW